MVFKSYIRYFIVILAFAFQSANGQIAVTNNPPFDTEENLVTNVLLGNGIIASNFSSVGFDNGIGYFDGNLIQTKFNKNQIPDEIKNKICKFNFD